MLARYDDPTPILRKLATGPEALELLFNVLSPARVAALAADPRLGDLRTLVLLDNRLGDDGLAGLLASPHLGRLERLTVRRNGLGAPGLRALAAWPGLARIRALDLGENPLGDEALATLVASPLLGPLRVLSLARVGGGLDALLHLPTLGQLAELDLGGNNLSDRHRTVFDWSKQGIDQLPPSDLAITLRRILGPRLKL